METREEEEKKPISQKQNSSQAANKARTPAEITTFTVKASASHGDVPWLRINDPGQVTQCIRLLLADCGQEDTLCRAEGTNHLLCRTHNLNFCSTPTQCKQIEDKRWESLLCGFRDTRIEVFSK